MPKPKKRESESDFVGRCIPILIGEGKSKEQAVAICYSMFRKRKKKKALGEASPAYIKSQME